MEEYDITRAIGKGKFATVYWAKRKNDGTNVALKRVFVPAMDDNSRSTCLREVQLLRSLDHCNIIRFIDVFQEEGYCNKDKSLVIVFEWAAAGDLKRQVRKALEREVHFKERIIWGYFSQICGAISYMHQQRIMHRDLKPANIFLTLEGQIKVGDLGLGRLMTEGNADEALAYSKVGTPLYMSPEVLRGGGYSWKSDIWSLGCILYELAMLRSPFKCEGLNLYSLVQKIGRGTYPPMLDYYSEDLRVLASGMIGTNPPNRPTAEEAYYAALTMKERIDRMGQPAEPPKTAAHLKLKTFSTQKKAGAENGKGEKDRAENRDKTRRTAARGTSKDGHPAAQTGAGQAHAEPSRRIGARAPEAGEAATGPRGDVCEPPPTSGGRPCPQGGPVGPRPAHEIRSTVGDEDGGRNASDSIQRRRHRRQQQQQRHHHHHHRGCHRNSNNHQHDERDGHGASQAAGFMANQRISHGDSRNGEAAATDVPVSRAAVGTTGMKEPNPAIAAASTCTRTARILWDTYHPEKRSAVTAPLLAVDQIAPPQSLPLQSEAAVVVKARGVSLPTIRRCRLAAKARVAKAMASKATAAAAAAAAAAEAGSAVEQPGDVPPRKVNSGRDPRWCLFAEARRGWNGVNAAPRAMTWGRAPPASQDSQVQQHKQQPQRATRGHGCTRKASPAAAAAAAAATTEVVAEVAVRGSQLPAVAVGRRIKTSKSTNNNTTTSVMTTTSSSSARHRRGQAEEEEENPSSGGSSASRKREEGGGGEGGRGDLGVGKERNDDVEMMMTAETCGGSYKDGDDGDDDGNLDGEENSKLRRVEERRERRRKKSDRSKKRENRKHDEDDDDIDEGDGDDGGDDDDNGNDNGDGNGSKPSSSLLRSPCAVGGDGGTKGARPKLKGTKAEAAPTTTPARGRERSSSQRRRQGGSTTSTSADAVAAVTAAVDNAANAAPATTGATKASKGSRAHAVGSADQLGRSACVVSGKNLNLAAMEARLVRSSIPGYEIALRVKNEPPLYRLRFVVPVGSGDDGSGGSGHRDGDGGSERTKTKHHFHSKQLLGCVSRSEWLPEQLGKGGQHVVGDGGGCAPAATAASSDAPPTVYVDIRQGSQGLGFEPCQAASGAGAEATALRPANHAVDSVGSCRAVLEVLGCSSKAALKKTEEKNGNGKPKTTQDGNGRCEGGEKQQIDTLDERGSQQGKGGGEGCFLRRGMVTGEPAAPDGRRTGTTWRGRGRGARMEASGQKKELAKHATFIGAVVEHTNNKKAAKQGRDNGHRDNNKAAFSLSNGNSCSNNSSSRSNSTSNSNNNNNKNNYNIINNSNSNNDNDDDDIDDDSDDSSSSSSSSNNDDSSTSTSTTTTNNNNNTSSNSTSGSAKARRWWETLPPEVLVLLTAVVVSSSSLCSSSLLSPWTSGCSCTSIFSCRRSRSHGSLVSSTQYSAACCFSNGDGGGDDDDEEDPQVVSSSSCSWAKDASIDGAMRSMVQPTTDLDAWRSEQQRVTPRFTRAAAAGQGDWHGILDVAAAAISREAAGDIPLPLAPVASLPTGDHGSECGGGVENGTGQSSKAVRGRPECLKTMLTRLGGELSRQLESVAAGERRLNGLGPYSGGRTLHLREEARLVRAEEAAVRAEVSERQDRVGALTDELRTLEDAAEEMNDKLVDAADKHSDPTRLCKTRSAIRQLKADVQAMDVLVGVNSAKLMGKQLRREQAAWKAAGRAPAGSRWGGLNAPARSRRESTRSPIFSATESSRSATLASSTLSTSPKRTTTPPTSAATTAPTSANSEPTSEEYDGGGNGGKREGGVVQQARKPPTEKVWSSTESSGRGQVLESRRSNVLIQAAVRLMTTKK